MPFIAITCIVTQYSFTFIFMHFVIVMPQLLPPSLALCLTLPYYWIGHIITALVTHCIVALLYWTFIVVIVLLLYLAALLLLVVIVVAFIVACMPLPLLPCLIVTLRCCAVPSTCSVMTPLLPQLLLQPVMWLDYIYGLATLIPYIIALYYIDYCYCTLPICCALLHCVIFTVDCTVVAVVYLCWLWFIVIVVLFGLLLYIPCWFTIIPLWLYYSCYYTLCSCDLYVCYVGLVVVLVNIRLPCWLHCLVRCITLLYVVLWLRYVGSLLLLLSLLLWLLYVDCIVVVVLPCYLFIAHLYVLLLLWLPLPLWIVIVTLLLYICCTLDCYVYPALRYADSRLFVHCQYPVRTVIVDVCWFGLRSFIDLFYLRLRTAPVTVGLVLVGLPVVAFSVVVRYIAGISWHCCSLYCGYCRCCWLLLPLLRFRYYLDCTLDCYVGYTLPCYLFIIIVWLLYCWIYITVPLPYPIVVLHYSWILGYLHSPYHYLTFIPITWLDPTIGITFLLCCYFVRLFLLYSLPWLCILCICYCLLYSFPRYCVLYVIYLYVTIYCAHWHCTLVVIVIIIGYAFCYFVFSYLLYWLIVFFDYWLFIVHLLLWLHPFIVIVLTQFPL